MPATILVTLRAGTADLHDRAEAAFVLGAPSVTRHEYAAVLARLLAFYSAAETALGAWQDTLASYGLDLAARRKAPLLARDLRALEEPLKCDAASTPSPAPPPDLPSALPTAARALGALYVLEGATLGGQLLRRRLGPALGLTPEHGLAFLTAYGPDVGPMWRSFGQALARFDAELPAAGRAAAHADTLAGARAAFEAFERDVVLPTARPAASHPALVALA